MIEWKLFELQGSEGFTAQGKESIDRQTRMEMSSDEHTGKRFTPTCSESRADPSSDEERTEGPPRIATTARLKESSLARGDRSSVLPRTLSRSFARESWVLRL